MKSLRIAASLILLAAFFPLLGHAQYTTSAVNGTVTDTTGAVVVGAHVSAVNIATGIHYQAVTNGAGAYHVTQLPPGTYTMRVSRTGFATQRVQPFKLFVEQPVEENITLRVGSMTQTVSVSAAAQLLNTTASSTEQLIENQQIENMPLNGRDYLQLAQLSAGVIPIVSGISSPASQWSAAGTVAVVIGGLREDDNSYLYDGIETRNAWYGAAGMLPDPDMIQEFKVEQSGASAQFGGAGAFITVVTKSGTNRFHGNAYEFLRNNDLDARNFFDVGAAPAFHQNQFGANLGGPIKRNKMFFFLDYEGFRQSQPNNIFVLVPNADQLAGNFSADTQQIYNPLVLDPASPSGYAPFPGNQIPKQDWNPIGQKILAMYPAANGSFNNGTANFHTVATDVNNWDQGSARFDYTISQKDTAFVRFTLNDQNAATPGITKYNLQLFPSFPKNLAVGWTHVFSPSLINNVRYGWSHTAVGLQRGDGFDKSAANPLGLINEDDQPGAYGPPSFGVSTYGNPGSTNGTDLVREGLNMWTEQLMAEKGRNQISVGLDIRYEPMFLYENWSATSIGFNGVYSGDPVADLLLGVPNTTRTALGDPTMNLHSWYQAYYVQDNMKVTPHLTLNIGARWEHKSPPVEANNRVGSFDTATGQDLTYPATKAMGLPGRNMVKPRWLNFSPRVGFNWAPTELNNTDIKGGFGMYYLQQNINQYEVEVDTTQLYEVDSFNNPPAGQPLSFTLSDMFSPTMTDGNFSGGGPTVSYIQPNAKTPYAFEWNLTVDHTLRNWLFELGYMGTSERHYEERNEIDFLNTKGIPTPWPQYSGVQLNQATGTSNYDSLVARVEKRYSSGFSFMGNYTWSKCLGTPYQDEFTWHQDMHVDYGHCTEDINQIMSVNSIYELPFGAGKTFLNRRGVLNQFVGGWKVAGIMSLHTGPWTTLGSNQNPGFFVGGLPNIIGPVNNHSLQWFGASWEARTVFQYPKRSEHQCDWRSGRREASQPREPRI